MLGLALLIECVHGRVGRTSSPSLKMVRRTAKPLFVQSVHAATFPGSALNRVGRRILVQNHSFSKSSSSSSGTSRGFPFMLLPREAGTRCSS